MNKIILEAKSITKEINTSAERLKILNCVNLSLSEGESLAIKGASGSGKSTLLDLLAGLELPQTGCVMLDGNNLSVMDEDQRAQLRADNVGFVFQSFHLIDDLTAAENISLPLELFGHNKPSVTAAKWLDKLGLAARASHFPRQLSGGEQQRVALGRAFALRPNILFADEPTANLDEQTSEKVLDQLFMLQKEHNISMVIATHDQSLAKRCDRTLHIQGGKLIERELDNAAH